MSNKLEATIGDRIVLYREGVPYKTVTIVQRKASLNGFEEIFVDTIDENGSYGNTFPTHRSVSELLKSYNESWNRSFKVVESKPFTMQFNVGDKVLRKEDNKEYIILYIGHMRNTRRAENEYYLILEDAKHDTNKSTCIYSFDINADFELVKDDVIQPLKYDYEIIKDMVKDVEIKRTRLKINDDEIVDKINEIIDYINKER